MSETIACQLMEAVQSAIDAGWSVNALAEAADVPQSALQMWMSGARKGISLETAAKLAEFFEQKLSKARIPKPPEGVMPQKGPPKRKKKAPKKSTKNRKL